MGQLLHGSATTTEAIRRAIQHSQASLRALSQRYGLNPKTVAKWKKRSFTSDARMGPKEPRSSVPSTEEEEVCIAFRRHTLLPLDDCLYALGLPLVWQGRINDEMDALAIATNLAPNDVQFAYVYAIALHSQGRSNDALARLERAREVVADDQAILEALVSINMELGRRPEALSYVEKLHFLRPDARALEQLVQQLRQGQ